MCELVIFEFQIINEQELAQQVGAHPGGLRCPRLFWTISPLQAVSSDPGPVTLEGHGVRDTIQIQVSPYSR